ncbi:MAG: gliding motility-associated C-terminal domain-containing protein [Chitinophagaceae bacterium]
MRFSRLSYCLLFFLFILSFNTARSQSGLCPSNLDFEQGNFSNWVCQAGIVDPAGNLVLAPTPPIPGRHTIITAATAGTDPWGLFPENCPNGSGYSVKLGNSGGNHQAESISYTYTIPNTLTSFSMIFHYAVVLQDPQHNRWEQPRFRARITDISSGSTIPCVDFDFVASSSLPGFIPSPFGQGVVYKDWTPITINLNEFVGKTIKLEFITNDCVFTAHFGYAYVDVNTNCNGAITGNTICPGDMAITLSAPFGFQGYEWYSDNTFSTLLSSTQTLYLNPPPSVGSVFPVIVIPYTGFGCRDTLYATVNVGARPNADAGPDVDICRNQQVQIGVLPNPVYTYLWTPAAQVSNQTASNPFAWTLTPFPEQFIVTTTDILTGCIANDTTYVTTRQIDTAIALNGSKTYCQGDPAAGILSVHNVLSAVQWYNGAVPVPGATGFTYQPTASGNYWAQVQQFSCTDTTATITFTINPLPVSIAGPDASICTNQSLQIGTVPNPAYTYTWTPAAQVSDPAVANPFAYVNANTPVEFIVYTVDPVTGCNSYDTTYITGRPVDTVISLTGKDIYCNGDRNAGTLFASNAVPSIQWYDGNTAVPGATGPSFHPLLSGNYWAELLQFGCTDSTRQIPFTVHPLPMVSFSPSNDSACITNNSFTFTNGTSVSDGSSLSYLWMFSDQRRQTGIDATKSFLFPGDYITKLIATSSNGCVDSTDLTVHVMPNGIPRFSFDSICVDRQINFYNLSDEKGAVQVNYSWDFGNSGLGSVLKNPPPVIYTTPGKTDVTLKLVTLGCEQNPMTLVKKVQINKPADGVRYRAITVPQGSSQYLHARPGIGPNYNWIPKEQLSNYFTQYTEFFATNNDIDYKVVITDVHTCVTTDSVLMQVLRKPGYYLPSAFTPNGDGLNDVAKPYLVGMKSLKSFSVFNRWGNRVFFTTTYGQGWDGKLKGVEQDAGVYVWILEYVDNNDKTIMEKGTITIIR